MKVNQDMLLMPENRATAFERRAHLRAVSNH